MELKEENIMLETSPRSVLKPRVRIANDQIYRIGTDLFDGFISSDKGVGYKDVNEDIAAYRLDENFLAVIDGMGGYGDGDAVSRALARHITEDPRNTSIARAVQATQAELKGRNSGDAGACFVTNHFILSEGKVVMKTTHAGDCRSIVIRQGEIVFLSTVDTYVDKLVQTDEITKSEALRHPERNVVLNAIQASRGEARFDPDFTVLPGDIVVSCTDGIEDNLTPEEICTIICSKSFESAFRTVWDTVGQRMLNCDFIRSQGVIQDEFPHVYNDGFQSEPKCDNRSLAILKIR